VQKKHKMRFQFGNFLTPSIPHSITPNSITFNLPICRVSTWPRLGQRYSPFDMADFGVLTPSRRTLHLIPLRSTLCLLVLLALRHASHFYAFVVSLSSLLAASLSRHALTAPILNVRIPPQRTSWLLAIMSNSKSHSQRFYKVGFMGTLPNRIQPIHYYLLPIHYHLRGDTPQ
jgi:hypothetical protein